MFSISYRSGSGRPREPGHRPAFSLIELVIVVVIIGIIAAIAIPRMGRGSAAATDSSMAQDLSILRNAVDAYQAEHNNQYPAANGGITVVQLLTQYSSIDGSQVSPVKDVPNGIVFGPYLRAVPALPAGAATEKGKSTLGPAGAGIAWVYDAVAGTVIPNTGALTDNGGRLYSSY